MSLKYMSNFVGATVKSGLGHYIFTWHARKVLDFDFICISSLNNVDTLPEKKNSLLNVFWDGTSQFVLALFYVHF